MCLIGSMISFTLLDWWQLYDSGDPAGDWELTKTNLWRKLGGVGRCAFGGWGGAVNFKILS